MLPWRAYQQWLWANVPRGTALSILKDKETDIQTFLPYGGNCSEKKSFLPDFPHSLEGRVGLHLEEPTGDSMTQGSAWRGQCQLSNRDSFNILWNGTDQKLRLPERQRNHHYRRRIIWARLRVFLHSAWPWWPRGWLEARSTGLQRLQNWGSLFRVNSNIHWTMSVITNNLSRSIWIQDLLLKSANCEVKL